MGQKLMFANDR